MSKRSIFFDAWQACLRSHYIHVIRTNDAVTEPTLRAVLLQSGLSEDDLHDLYQEALALGPLDADAPILPEPDTPPLPDDLPERDAEADELYADDLPEPVLDALAAVDDDAPEEVEEVEDIEEMETTEEIDEPPPDESPPAEQLSMF